MEPDALQLQMNNNLPTVAPPHTTAFLPWQLEEECGAGNNDNPVGDGGPIFPPRSSDAMRFPYQDGPKKKKARSPPPPLSNSPGGSPELVLRNPSSEDGKEREGKKRTTQTPTTVTSSTQHSQASVTFLNIVVAILVVSVGLLLANKFF